MKFDILFDIWQYFGKTQSEKLEKEWSVFLDSALIRMVVETQAMQRCISSFASF